MRAYGGPWIGRGGWRSAAALSLAILASAAFAVPACASSDQSWGQLKSRVIEACRRQSGLRSTKIVGYWPYFEAKAAAMVSGVYPERHMKGRRGVMLCLYDKRTGKAETQEAGPR
jgi:hypothetical protein